MPQDLKDAKIFHNCPVSAADHINEIWGCIEDWWCEDEVQIARELFIQKYASDPIDFTTQLTV